jgi:hypothetical protein
MMGEPALQDRLRHEVPAGGVAPVGQAELRKAFEGRI